MSVVEQAWLAEKLGMKSAANVCRQRRRLDREAARRKVPAALREFVESLEKTHA